MHISRFNSIPRFALPYTAADFVAGLRAVFDGGPPPEAFATVRRPAEVLDTQRPAGAPAPAGSAQSQTGIGRCSPLVYGPIPIQGHRGRGPQAGLHRRGPMFPDD